MLFLLILLPFLLKSHVISQFSSFSLTFQFYFAHLYFTSLRAFLPEWMMSCEFSVALFWLSSFHAIFLLFSYYFITLLINFFIFHKVSLARTIFRNFGIHFSREPILSNSFDASCQYWSDDELKLFPSPSERVFLVGLSNPFNVFVHW